MLPGPASAVRILACGIINRLRTDDGPTCRVGRLMSYNRPDYTPTSGIYVSSVVMSWIMTSLIEMDLVGWEANRHWV